MLNLNATTDKTLSLTDAELQILSDMLATHDRAGFYAVYNAMTT